MILKLSEKKKNTNSVTLIEAGFCWTTDLAENEVALSLLKAHSYNKKKQPVGDFNSAVFLFCLPHTSHMIFVFQIFTDQPVCCSLYYTIQQIMNDKIFIGLI